MVGCLRGARHAFSLRSATETCRAATRTLYQGLDPYSCVTCRGSVSGLLPPRGWLSLRTIGPICSDI